MGKNIILLSDGTGNSAAKLHKTNVWRVYQAIDLTSDEQVALYDDGVGVSRFRPLALLGSGFGFGLARNVRHLYAFLSRNYKEKDYNSNNKPKIFAFGFSRGAYTIRLLIGLVRNQGLVNSELPEDEFQLEVRQRWDAYRQRFRWRWVKIILGAPTEREPDELGKLGRVVPQFKFVGLWDTVGAYGLPFEELQGLIPLARLPDRHLSSIVKCAYHALSLDDERRSFHPILWDEDSGDENKDVARNSKRIRQVWFPGVHSNVGGGYPKDGLSYVSLQWMIRKAELLGLTFLQTHLDEIDNQVNAHDQMYNSRAGLGGYYRYSPRPVSRLCNDFVQGVKIHRPKIHEGTFKRISDGRVAYGPIGVPLVYDLVLQNGDVIPGPCEAVKDANGKTKIAATKSDGEPGGQYLEAADPTQLRATRMEAADIRWRDAGMDATGELEIVVMDSGGEPTSQYLEDGGRAQLRATRMEAAWNIVWWRRIVYFLTVLFSVFLVASPWLAEYTKKFLPEGDLELIARYVKPILTAASYFIPDWVGRTWLGTSGEEPVSLPVLFLVGSLGVIVMMLIGWWLDKRIHSRASDIWHFKATSQVPKWARKPKSTLLYKLRSNSCVIWTYRKYRKAAPIILLLGLAGIIGWLWAAGSIGRFWEEYSDYITTYVILVVGLAVLGVAVPRAWRMYKWATIKMSRGARQSEIQSQFRTVGTTTKS